MIVRVARTLRFRNPCQDSALQADDIILKLKEQLPKEQMSMQYDDKEAFRCVSLSSGSFAIENLPRVALMKQDAFKPYGELISKFTSAGRFFELYRFGAQMENR